MSIIVMILLVIIIISAIQYYRPNIDIVIEEHHYKILLWYNKYTDNVIHRKYKKLLVIKRNKL